MDQLKQIFDKLNSMEDRIIAIDTSIRGDEERGVMGIKQHMAGLKEDFHKHVESDAEQFGLLDSGQNKINETISKVKWWFLGGSFVVTCVVGLVSVLLKFVK